jgi:hypothetical protein
VSHAPTTTPFLTWNDDTNPDPASLSSDSSSLSTSDDSSDRAKSQINLSKGGFAAILLLVFVVSFFAGHRTGKKKIQRHANTDIADLELIEALGLPTNERDRMT